VTVSRHEAGISEVGSILHSSFEDKVNTFHRFSCLSFLHRNSTDTLYKTLRFTTYCYTLRYATTICTGILISKIRNVISVVLLNSPWPWCEIWGFHGDEKWNCGLLGCCVVWCGGWIPKFRKTALQPWRWRQHGPSKRWHLTTTLHGVTTKKTTNPIYDHFLHTTKS